VARLPIYQRILVELQRLGAATTSSEELGRMAGVNAAKVRKDLSSLGTLGTRGTGYDPRLLIAQIDRALGADRDWPVVVVGMGNLGRALVNSEGFSSHGFHVSAVFDVDPKVVGAEVAGLVVRHADRIGELALAGAPAVGVVATPASAAQGVVDALVGAGACAILNFAPRVVTVPAHVLLRYVDLSIELQIMSFYLTGRAPEPAGLAPIRSVGVSQPGAAG